MHHLSRRYQYRQLLWGTLEVNRFDASLLSKARNEARIPAISIYKIALRLVPQLLVKPPLVAYKIRKIRNAAF